MPYSRTSTTCPTLSILLCRKESASYLAKLAVLPAAICEALFFLKLARELQTSLAGGLDTNIRPALEKAEEKGPEERGEGSGGGRGRGGFA